MNTIIYPEIEALRYLIQEQKTVIEDQKSVIENMQNHRTVRMREVEAKIKSLQDLLQSSISCCCSGCSTCNKELSKTINPDWNMLDGDE